MPAPATSDADLAVSEPAPIPGTYAPIMWVFAGLSALIAAAPISDNSFLTHLATGRLIVDGGLPNQNPFLYSSTDFPVPSYWWSIVLGAVDWAAGATGLRLLTAALAGLLGALLVRMTASSEASELVAAASPSAAEVTQDGSSLPGLLAVLLPAGLGFICLLSFLNGRPHLIGFVLLALMVLVWKEGRSPWWLLPIFAVWVNVHGSWLYGLIVLGMYLVATTIDTRKLMPKQFALAGTAVLGVVIGGALYPDRFALLLLPAKQFGDPIEREALQSYQEWGRVGFDEPMLWMMLAIAILAIFGCIRQRRYAMTVMVGLLVILGFSGLRLVPIAAVALLPFAAIGLRGIGTVGLPSGRMAKVLGGFGLLLCLAAGARCVIGPSYQLDAFPVAAVDWLEARDLVGNDTRVTTHDFAGNYLEWRYGDQANTWVDDRPGAATMVAYVNMLRLSEGWQKSLAGSNGDVLIWRTSDKLTGELKQDPEWVVGTQAGEFTVFCKAELADRCS
ncbi:hypothetical protein IMCC26207_10228 [Actinobacteria bacterium IMCC26207]|nr:hypothetical protein IMCC26207_10228 [Actinobacteria bacterium IMCC26207]